MASRSSICSDVITKKKSQSIIGLSFDHQVCFYIQLNHSLRSHVNWSAIFHTRALFHDLVSPGELVYHKFHWYARDPRMKTSASISMDSLPSINALLIWCYGISLLFSKIWRPLCSLFVHLKWLLIILQVYVGESEGWSAGERRENRNCMSYQKPISPPRSI